MAHFLLVGDDVAGTSVPFNLPTGTVTFLLTDIEASSSGWEADPDRMGAAVSRHYEILESVVSRWGGVRPVEQGEGDSVVAAFSRASDATHAALDAQRELLDELDDTLVVRIALHTGDAQLRDEGNYFGPTVIRCARLRSCAHGGQILLSNATADLVFERLPEAAQLVDLGEHRLKDLQRPERVFELCHPTLPKSGRFPPLRSLDAYFHNLPASMTPLIGRESELHDVCELMMAERLVTLTGTGGCGKTRLAAEVAARLIDRFDGGVWWCELASRSEDDAVATMLGALLGAAEPPGPGLLAAVAARLRIGGPTLIVLDNAEHMLEGVATATAELLRHAPDARALVTSREPLSVPGEVAWRVPSLGVPPAADTTPRAVERLAEFAAVELFVERAARARSGFALTDENADAVTSICRRLDGIPLAIELTAARIRTMAPERIAAQLDDRFRLLAGGARTLLPRQQTLLASVAWSEALLEESERAALRRVGVFVGGFTMEAAEDVLGSFDDTDPYEVLDLVGRLVDKSLVSLEDSGRYRLLETIRSYALARLVETGEATVARDAHADWARRFAAAHYAAFHIETAFGAWFDEMDTEWPNVAAAFEWLSDQPAELLELVASTGQFFLTGQRLADAFKYGYENIARFADEPPDTWYQAVARSRAILYNLGAEHSANTARARDLAFAAGDEAAVLQCELGLLLDRLRTRLGEEELADARSLVARATALGDSQTEFSARLVPWQFLVVGGRMAEASLDAPMPIEHPRTGSLCALAATHVGELDRAAAILRATDLSLAPARQEGMVVASMADWLAVLSGERHAVDVDVQGTPTPDERLYAGIWGELRYLYELRRAVRAGDWDRVRHVDTVDRVRFSDRNTVRVDALLLLALVATGSREGVRVRAEQLVRSAGEIGAPAQQIDGLLVIAELDASEVHAFDALALARQHNLVLAQIDALEMLAITGSPEFAAQLKASAASERARRDYMFHWPSRAALLEAVPVPDATEVLDLERIGELALRGRGRRGRPAFGWDALTPTELEVAREVAAGLTNAEVGERLGIQASTVKTHLDHIYAKLGIKRRSALAAAVEKRD